jgi:hypothetical protein
VLTRGFDFGGDEATAGGFGGAPLAGVVPALAHFTSTGRTGDGHADARPLRTGAAAACSATSAPAARQRPYAEPGTGNQHNSAEDHHAAPFVPGQCLALLLAIIGRHDPISLEAVELALSADRQTTFTGIGVER